MENDTVKRFKQVGRTKLIHGSILTPETGGLRLILSFANMAGTPKCELMPIFDKKWRKVKEEIKGWYSGKTGSYKLGSTAQILTTAVQSDIWVLSMLVQDKDLNVDQKTLETCLKQVCKTALYERATVHVSTLLTNAFPELSDLIKTHLIEEGVSVYFYEEK